MRGKNLNERVTEKNVFSNPQRFFFPIKVPSAFVADISDILACFFYLRPYARPFVKLQPKQNTENIVDMELGRDWRKT